MIKRKILLSLTILFIVFASFSVIYAYASKIDLASLTSNNSNLNQQNTTYVCVSEENSEVENSKQEEILTAVSNYIPTLITNTSAQATSLSLNDTSGLKTYHDNTINQDYYDLITNDYSISIAEDLTLRAFSDNTFNYDLATTMYRTTAETFITNFYNNLDIEHDYELAYLEVFDDSMWEADYVKKIDGIYNYYDSVKIFFSPNQQKIAALRIHSTSYANEGISTASINISELEAKNIVKENFSNISDTNITNVELVFTKPNNFFTKQTGSDIISENNVVKAWKVTVEQNLTTMFIFIDCKTGSVIGGEQIK